MEQVAADDSNGHARDATIMTMNDQKMLVLFCLHMNNVNLNK